MSCVSSSESSANCFTWLSFHSDLIMLIALSTMRDFPRQVLKFSFAQTSHQVSFEDRCAPRIAVLEELRQFIVGVDGRSSSVNLASLMVTGPLPSGSPSTDRMNWFTRSILFAAVRGLFFCVSMHHAR
jgi:hypothetical protein